MNKWLPIGITLVLVSLLIGYFNWPEPIFVQIATVERGLVEYTVANTRVGTIKACERSRLSPAIGGQVANLYVKEGDRVEAQAVLLELWNKDRKARLKQAQAMQSFAGQDRRRVCIGAQANQREARRFKELASRNLASEEVADQTRSLAQVSEAACASTTAKLEEARAAVLVAEAALDQTLLRAPFSGVIAEVTGEIGEFTTPSPPGVATPPAIDILTDDCYYLSAPIDEVDASLVKLGLPVRVTLDAFRDQVFDGSVRQIATYVRDYEKQARTVDVEVSLETEDQQRLIAGYSADVEILLQTQQNTVRIPTGALLDEQAVFVLSKDSGTLEKRAVKVGIRNWQFTQIVDGLKEGETVILTLGRSDLKHGDRAKASLSSN